MQAFSRPTLQVMSYKAWWMQPSEFTGLQTARNRLHLHNDDLDEHGTNPPPTHLPPQPSVPPRATWCPGSLRLGIQESERGVRRGIDGSRFTVSRCALRLSPAAASPPSRAAGCRPRRATRHRTAGTRRQPAAPCCRPLEGPMRRPPRQTVQGRAWEALPPGH